MNYNRMFPSCLPSSGGRGGGEAIEREAHRPGLVWEGGGRKEHRLMPAGVFSGCSGKAGDFGHN